MEPVRVRGLPQPGRTVVMGVVNVTPDSFSDGGEWFDHEAAIRHGRQLLAEGADLIDVGGESTRPGADRPDPAEELRRVLPVIEAWPRPARRSVSTPCAPRWPGKPWTPERSWSTTSPAVRRTRR